MLIQPNILPLLLNKFLMRNNKGQFMLGYKEDSETKSKRLKAALDTFKLNPKYLGAKKYTYLYNSWRCIKHTARGKKIGWAKEWDVFINFYNDMIDSYSDGLRLFRVDLKDNYNKNNCKWMTQEQAHVIHNRHNILEYNGEVKSLKDWSLFYGIPLNGLKQRFNSKGKLTNKEILFGREIRSHYKSVDHLSLEVNKRRSKASKMISSYRCYDKKRGNDCDLTIEYLIENIFTKRCVYCDTDKAIGCDRIDNSKGHTIENILPACYSCNTIRMDKFTVDEMKVLGKTISEIFRNRKIE